MAVSWAAAAVAPDRVIGRVDVLQRASGLVVAVWSARQRRVLALPGRVTTQRLQPSSILVTIQPVYCDPKPPAPLLPCHDIPNCIVTRPASQANPQSRYNSLYRDSVSQPLSLPIAIQFSATAHPPYIAIHLGVLQYSSSACLALSLSHNTLQCIAIQLLSNPTAHVTIKYQPMHTQAAMSYTICHCIVTLFWAVAQSIPEIFFFRFSLFFFTH